jgi:adenine-specific DNA-methyltransferase
LNAGLCGTGGDEGKLASGTIRYLGNKRRLAPRIGELVRGVLHPGGTVVDLFAGSSAVGRYLLPDYRVVANDVECYSYCIAKALIEDSGVGLSARESRRLLYRHYERNLNQLMAAFSGYLDKEKDFLGRPRAFRKYRDFCRHTPYVRTYRNTEVASRTTSVFRQSEEGVGGFPYSLFSTYFMNAYFGVRQCLQIDSIRYSIDQAAGPHCEPKDRVLFHQLVTALLYSLSHCVSSPGHFAQHAVSNNGAIHQYLLRERSKDMWSCFLGYIKQLFSRPVENGHVNLAVQEPALSLLVPSSPHHETISNDSIIYADPPYTADHYSRYYHVLNTLVLYDYPACEGRGRYRTGRYASPFSLRSQAKRQLGLLISKAANASVPVILSYLDDALVDLDAVADLCGMHFGTVDAIEVDYNHSNQGRATTSCSSRKARRKEMLYVCVP